MLNLVNTHSSLFKEITEAVTSYSKGHFCEVLSDHFRQIYTDEDKYWDQIVAFFPSVLSNEEFKEELKPFFEENIEKIISNFESLDNEQHQCSQMIFLTELWIEFPEIISADNSTAIINLLKIIARTQKRAIKYAIVTQMFRLLEIFSAEKKSEAPILYKALIFVLVDSHSDDTTRAFIMGNFINFFEVSETIPVGILLDPLIKQFMESEGTTYKYNTFDFEFFIS